MANAVLTTKAKELAAPESLRTGKISGPTRTATVCAWCSGYERLTKEYEDSWFCVSHGLCRVCAKKYFK